MKKVKIPKGFIETRKKLPMYGKNIIIFLRNGESYRAMRVETALAEQGYCYEDINMHDHDAENVIAWKDGR